VGDVAGSTAARTRAQCAPFAKNVRSAQSLLSATFERSAQPGVRLQLCDTEEVIESGFAEGERSILISALLLVAVVGLIGCSSNDEYETERGQWTAFCSSFSIPPSHVVRQDFAYDPSIVPPRSRNMDAREYLQSRQAEWPSRLEPELTMVADAWPRYGNLDDQAPPQVQDAVASLDYEWTSGGCVELAKRRYGPLAG
jgi:hypothetical protein